MFWVEVENPKIGKAAMDGTSKESIVTSDITWPNGIAIDYTSKLSSLYFFHELSFDRKIKVFKKYIIWFYYLNASAKFFYKNLQY